MGNYVLRKCRKTPLHGESASVLEEGTRAHCGHNVKQEELGDSHFWGEDMKDDIKEKVHWKMGLFSPLFKDSFEIIPVGDFVSHSMISVCSHLKEVH